ncbi:prepilin-type N-terminal cleavage/methylation domain-containing protein [SAR116 cluster bacterium]|nr:prepilin-type N-terminal cleavage/methylation domain-containing protein [SAR116 cluster bacterium]
MRRVFLKFCKDVRGGFSLVEMLVAVALLSIVSMAAIQMIGMTDETMLGESIKLNSQQESEAISSYLYKDFIDGKVGESTTPQIYKNATMPNDLQKGDGVEIVTLVGNSGRLNGIDPICPLLFDANISAGTFKFTANCISRNGVSIAESMNRLIAKGVSITAGFDGGIGRCTISQPLVIDQSANVATVRVDDANCLKWGQNASSGVPKGTQILMPRFVAYNAKNPALFHTSLIEVPDVGTPGIGIEMPDRHRMIGGGIINAANIVDTLVDDPQTNITVQLSVAESLSTLDIGSPAMNVMIKGSLSQSLEIAGKATDVRVALEKLQYRSPPGFFGTDNMTGRMVVDGSSLIKQDNTVLDVIANCGNQTCGTAVRFDLGTYDPATSKFKVTEYITSVSMCGNEMPTKFYGYCGTKFRFDRPDGARTTYASSQHPNYCKLAKSLTAGDPANWQTETYVLYSPKAREFQKSDRVTVFLYEQYSGNSTVTDPKGANALTNNRYSLFFQFDTFDQSAGSVNFQLNNVQANRDLGDIDDPFTFLDDTSEYTPQVMGPSGRMTTIVQQNGILTTDASWKIPNDGVIVPLNLGNGAYDPVTKTYELKNYAHDPDGDGNVNPNLRMLNWVGLDGWNIRATNAAANAVIWRTIDFDAGMPDQKTDIQLRVKESQRCDPNEFSGGGGSAPPCNS